MLAPVGEPEVVPRRLRNAALPKISPLMWRMFSGYATKYVAKQFHTVRVSRGGQFPEVPSEPLAIYLNHPAWWDPLVCIFLARTYLNHRANYGPFDSAALSRYRILEKIGCFGIEQGTARGAIRFLQIGGEVLRTSDAALWITAQGEFVDTRRRPIVLRSGLGHLASRAERATFVPLAIEYSYWTERCAEVLLRFGRPLRVGVDGIPPGDASAWTAALAERLEVTQDELAQESQQRDPADFVTLLSGSAGINWFYDAWRRGWSRVRGRTFQLEHGASPQ